MLQWENTEQMNISNSQINIEVFVFKINAWARLKSLVQSIQRH